MPEDSRLAIGLVSRDNTFNIIRLGLAVTVMLDHAWQLSLGDGSELFKIFGLTAGYIAVNGFFVLSGLLIARSIDTRGFGLRYIRARIMRLYPALIALALIATLVIGPWVAGSDYWQSGRVFDYAFEILHFGRTDGGPVGFYPDNPIPNEFSAPLWTLRYEVICYALAPFALLFGIIRQRWLMLAATALLGLAVLAIHNLGLSTNLPDTFLWLFRFAFAFVAGMTVWTWRDSFTFTAWQIGALTLLFVISGLVGFGESVTATLWVGGLCIWLGIQPSGDRLKLKNTDISYGVYIWHFPIMQIVAGETDGLGPWLLLFSSAPIVVLASYASWRLIERPAMSLKKRDLSSV